MTDRSADLFRVLLSGIARIACRSAWFLPARPRRVASMTATAVDRSVFPGAIPRRHRCSPHRCPSGNEPRRPIPRRRGSLCYRSDVRLWQSRSPAFCGPNVRLREAANIACAAGMGAVPPWPEADSLVAGALRRETDIHSGKGPWQFSTHCCRSQNDCRIA
jgi:hypothetical protein